MVRQNLVALPRAVKSLIATGADYLGFVACAATAFWVVMPSQVGVAEISGTLALLGLLSVGVLWLRGLYRSVIRYVGMDLLRAAFGASMITAIAGGMGALALLEPPLAARWAFTFFSSALIYVVASRFLARLFLLNHRARQKRDKVIIYGAGSAAAQLIPNLLSNDEFLPVALVDDDISLQGTRINGITVYSPEIIEKLISKMKASRVLLALPSASRRKRRQVLERLSEHPVHVQTIPKIADIVNGKARVDDIRDVEVKDLLGRDPVPPDETLLNASIRGKTVMVTGAGGSIGSELCRQIIRLCPKRLILIEISEPSLYTVDRELQRIHRKLDCDCEIIPLLGSVHHEHRLTEIISSFEVSSVYHAAAYKHVPIVEHNIFEGIHNNVLGTLHSARAAIAGGADSFVLVSTDKAVNPTNVMGATKRFAELVLQALHDEGGNTRFSMVRFGNVLESSGSVVPLFKEQIRSGGPVTVTHRDIIRYFMTIPEAAQLVIQAGAMAKGGDVFVLDMGKPVKILDLAHRMIKLMGLTIKDSENPDGDIDVEIVGLRPAEKLYEELLIGSNVTGTRHPRIMRADEEFLPLSELTALLDELVESSQQLEFERARDVLIEAVAEYRPANEIEDLVWSQKSASGEVSKKDTVIEFPERRPAV